VNFIESWEAQSNQWTEWARSPGLLPPAARQKTLVFGEGRKTSIRMTLLPMKKPPMGTLATPFARARTSTINWSFARTAGMPRSRTAQDNAQARHGSLA